MMRESAFTVNTDTTQNFLLFSPPEREFAY